MENKDIENIFPEDARYNGKTFSHHKARYILASMWKTKRISALDVCCGSGYGANILRKNGYLKVTGIDNSKKAIDYAKKHFGGIKFFKENITKFDFKNKYDLVTLFEALEHLGKKNGLIFLKSIPKLINKDGAFIMSIPRENGSNKFHITNWTFLEIKHELSKGFKNVLILGQDWSTAAFTLVEPQNEDFYYFIAWN